jgi:signal peptidase I
MYPVISPGERLVLPRYWPQKWLRKGQIIVGDFSRVPHFHLEPPSTSLDFAPGSQQEPPPVEPHQHYTSFFTSNVNQKSEMLSLYNSRFVKRITGLPGDMICIHISSLHPGLQSYLRNQCNPNGNLIWHIPVEYCFVRSDAPAGGDSITWGPIPVRAIVGPVLMKLPPEPSTL